MGKFTHADAGQMNMYLNYARQHWINADENPPVGLMLCSEKDAAVARYQGSGNTVLAREYELAMPNEHRLAEKLESTRSRILLFPPREGSHSGGSAEVSRHDWAVTVSGSRSQP